MMRIHTGNGWGGPADVSQPDEWLAKTACGTRLIKWDPEEPGARFGMARAYKEDGSGYGFAVKIEQKKQAEADAYFRTHRKQPGVGNEG